APSDAWARARWGYSLAVIRGPDLGDWLEMTVGSNGLPAWISVKRGQSAALSVRYRSWLAVENVAWPGVITFEDGAGTWSLSCRVARLRFDPHPDRERLSLRLPAGAEHLTVSDLKRLF